MRISLLSDTNNWMNAIDDNTNLAHISIPGTHDSCAHVGASQQPEMFDKFIATQNKECTITKQLEKGIRYLDIRCCVIDGIFAIHHGVFYLHINFGDVLNECIHFLAINNSETIVMRIKQEYSSVSDEEFINIFNGYYGSYQSSMYLGNQVPILGNVRGKIVILANVFELPGIPYDSINTQDDYTDTDIEKKLGEIVNFIDQSINTNNTEHKSELYLNQCNATNPWEFIGPKDVANKLNPKLENEFINNIPKRIINGSISEPAHIGVISMDFYTDPLVSEVIERN
ncbi:MAG: phosphatidylinositol-specific phospholipase C [Enterobacteriaceae bacterium]|jgi:1-phosphatidylinositol phosphodiesterase|nr:phosphatidylinositol-specific phospholipase C [Enterobacteriaceae bacterium]